MNPFLYLYTLGKSELSAYRFKESLESLVTIAPQQSSHMGPYLQHLIQFDLQFYNHKKKVFHRL